MYILMDQGARVYIVTTRWVRIVPEEILKVDVTPG